MGIINMQLTKAHDENARHLLKRRAKLELSPKASSKLWSSLRFFCLRDGLKGFSRSKPFNPDPIQMS